MINGLVLNKQRMINYRTVIHMNNTKEIEGGEKNPPSPPLRTRRLRKGCFPFDVITVT